MFVILGTLQMSYLAVRCLIFLICFLLRHVSIDLYFEGWEGEVPPKNGAGHCCPPQRFCVYAHVNFF